MSPKTVDPVEASFEAWPDDPGLGKEFGEVALSLSGLVFPFATILTILKDQFDSASRAKRVKYLLDGLVLKLKLIESEQASSRDKLKDIQERLETPRFRNAVAMACEESARASNTKTVECLTAVLTGEADPGQWADPNSDLAATIRYVAQLGDQDIEALDVLRAAFREVIVYHPNLNDPNAFTEKMQDYRDAIQLNKFEAENFYALCARLSGFGLAIEVVRNSSRMQLHEYLFRPTRRGLDLLDCLDKCGSGRREGPEK